MTTLPKEFYTNQGYLFPKDHYKNRDSYRFTATGAPDHSIRLNSYNFDESPYLQELYQTKDRKTFTLRKKYKSDFHYQEGEQHYFFISENPKSYYNALNRRFALDNGFEPPKLTNFILIVNPKELTLKNSKMKSSSDGYTLDETKTFYFPYQFSHVDKTGKLLSVYHHIFDDFPRVCKEEYRKYPYIFCQDKVSLDPNEESYPTPFINFFCTDDLGRALYFCKVHCPEEHENEIKTLILDTIFDKED